MMVRTNRNSLEMAERLPPLAPGTSYGPTLQAASPDSSAKKDPVFLVMFTGQIESAEASILLNIAFQTAILSSDTVSRV